MPEIFGYKKPPMPWEAFLIAPTTAFCFVFIPTDMILREALKLEIWFFLCPKSFK